MKSKLILTMLSLFIVMASLFLGGCSQKEETSSKEQKNYTEDVNFDPELAQKIKQEVEKVDGIEESITVVLEKKISTAVKVTGFDRLKLKSIRQEVHNKIKSIVEKEKENYEIHVTSDKKLFKSIEEVYKASQKEISKEESINLKKKLDKINEDMQG